MDRCQRCETLADQVGQLRAEVERLKQAESLQFESRADYAERLHAAELQLGIAKKALGEIRDKYATTEIAGIIARNALKGVAE